MRHKMTLGHFSKDLIRPPVSGGQFSKQERSASLNPKLILINMKHGDTERLEILLREQGARSHFDCDRQSLI